jgi:hypothetical protein
MRGLFIGIAAASLSLAGCATEAQRIASSIRSQSAEAVAAGKQCLSEIAANPQYASIAKHAPLDGTPASVAQKADESLATPQEAQTVLAWRSDIGQCRQTFTESAQRFAPAAVPALLEASNASDAVWVKVVHRQITWGTALQQAADIQAAIQAKGVEVEKEMQASLEQQNQTELAQRRAVAAAFGQALKDASDNMQRQQLINAIDRPRTTNCSAFGNSASCATY